MTDGVVKTFWLKSNGAIAVHAVYADEFGVVYGESGDPAPEGTELTSEQITSRLRLQMVAESEAYEARSGLMAEAHTELVKERATKVSSLVGAGLPEAAAEILVPQVGPVLVQPEFKAPVEAYGSLRGYGLSDDQVRQVLGRWG